MKSINICHINNNNTVLSLVASIFTQGCLLRERDDNERVLSPV